eukprot:GILJ01008246.1.p1 GENE.GILJ01008246.1~~GILJ01008246.1.p1  ORF type:complete len:149 (-),score=1.06 GILJ01008246.1:150-596(-)
MILVLLSAAGVWLMWDTERNKEKREAFFCMIDKVELSDHTLARFLVPVLILVPVLAYFQCFVSCFYVAGLTSFLLFLLASATYTRVRELCRACVGIFAVFLCQAIYLSTYIDKVPLAFLVIIGTCCCCSVFLQALQNSVDADTAIQPD